MTIPETPFSDCDCCGYGSELFELSIPSFYYHRPSISTISKYEQNNGDQILPTLGWDDRPTNANQRQQIHTITNRNFLYGYDQSSPTGGICSVSKRDLLGDVIWDYYPGPGGTLSVPLGTTTVFFNAANSQKADVFKPDGTVVIAGGELTEEDNGDPDVHLIVNRVHVLLINDSGSLVDEFIFTPPSPTSVDTSAYPDANFVNYGYVVNDLCITSGGDIHLSGIAQLLVRKLVHLGGGSIGTTVYWNDFGRFELQIDRDGNTLWSDIETLETPGTGGGAESKKSWGRHCVADDLGNVHVAYVPTWSGGATTDNLVLVGFDSSGTEIYTKAAAFGESEQIAVSRGDLYRITPRGSVLGSLQRYSGPTFSTQVWSQSTGPTGSTTFVSVGAFALDRSGNIFTAMHYGTTGGNSALRKKFDPDGSLLWSATGPLLFGLFPVVPPGRPPHFIG